MAPVIAVVRTIFAAPRFTGLLAAGFLLGLVSSLVSPFLSLWGTNQVGLTPSGFGLFMTVTSFSAITLSMTLAHWSDSHVARRTILIIGPISGMIGYLGYAYVRHPVVLGCIGSLALGVAAVNFSQLFAFTREELARPENATLDRPLLMSLLRVFFSLAWVAGPAIGAAVMLHFSYRGIFLASAALFFLFLVVVLRFVPHRPHAPVAQQIAREPLGRVLTKPVIFAHFTGLVLVFAAFTMNMINLPLFVTHQLGGDERQVGIIFGIAPVVEMPLMIWFGKLAARGRQVGLMRFGVAVAVAYFLTLTLVRTPWHIYPLQLLSAASIAVTTNITITFFQDLLPGQTGVATSIYSSSTAVGTLAGYFSFGMLIEHVGNRGVYLACAALCAITLGILLLSRHTHSTPPTSAPAR